MILYKRNAKGEPIFWEIEKGSPSFLSIRFGIVSKSIHYDTIKVGKNIDVAYNSYIREKRKQGYKEIKDLYDNAPTLLPDANLLHYLNTYLPKFNTHEDGNFIPMLCKTLQDNKPFEKGNYFGQWKINGERCIITASKTNDLFANAKLHYRSREGVDWTNKLSYLDDAILPKIHGSLLAMMIDEGVGLDGELYLPGYSINEINSFIKNTELPQHYQLQYWCYDLCIENMTAVKRQSLLNFTFSKYIPTIHNKADHYNNKEQFVLVPNKTIDDIIIATEARDFFIELGFEGLVIRNEEAEYQFGGKRNNAMLKYKRKEDGLFDVVDIKSDKRGLPVFTLKNDLNDELFDATINIPQKEQIIYFTIKDTVVKNGKALVEFRERSGVKQVPFHAKIIKINL